MATLNLYLDSRRPRNDGSAMLKISVRHHNRSCLISTGHYIPLKYWNKQSNCLTSEADITTRRVFNSASIQLAQANEALFEMESKNSPITVESVRESINAKLFPKPESEKEDYTPGLLKCFSLFSRTKEGRTKQIYDTTAKRIKEFTRSKEIPLDEVGRDWLSRFDVFLSENSPSKNARAIHMRNIRAVFNWAIDEEYTQSYPFRRFKIKYEPTKKRALSVEAIRKIISADLSGCWFEHYRDFFVLSFYLIGINTVDLCRMTRLSADGRAEYIRAKTHKRYSIKVEPEAMKIINSYRGEKFLFRDLDKYSDYRYYVNMLCSGLEALRKHLNGIDDGIVIDNLSSYWARHSWATIARSIGISVDDIALALGHGDGHDLTHIYIDDDKKKVDEANRRVIDWVLYGKK